MTIIKRQLRNGNRYNTPELIVVHAMGEFIKDPNPVHAVDFLKKYGLSAHTLVDASGDIYLCRKTTQGAYHARGFNTNSLGIEFLVEGVHDYGSFLDAIKTDYITSAQFEAGVDLVRQWISDHSIKDVVRHSDISPGRKLDPGSGFKWEKFKTQINAEVIA